MTTIEEVYQSFLDRQYAYRDDYDREYKRQIAEEYADDPVTFRKMYPMDNDPYATDVVTRYLDQEDVNDESYTEPNDPFAVLSVIFTIFFLLWLFVLRHIPYRAIYDEIAGVFFKVFLFIVDPPVPRPLPAFRGDIRCYNLDLYPVVPYFTKRRIVKLVCLWSLFFTCLWDRMMAVKHLEASLGSFITVVAACIIAVYFQFFFARNFALEPRVLEMPVSDNIVWSPSRNTYVAAELADRPEPHMTPASRLTTANASRLSAPAPVSTPVRQTTNLPIRSANNVAQRPAPRSPIRPSTPHPARAPMRPSTPHPRRVTNRPASSSEWLHPAGGIEQYEVSANGTPTGLKKGFSFSAVCGDLERDSEAARAAAAANYNQTPTRSPVTDTTVVAPQTQTGIQTQTRSAFGLAVDNVDHSSNWTASSANIGANPARTIATSGTALSAHDILQSQPPSFSATAIEPYVPVAKDWTDTGAQPPHYFACDEPNAPPFSDESPDPFHNYQAKAPVFRDNLALSHAGVNQAQAQSFSGNSLSSSSSLVVNQAQTSAFSGNPQPTYNSYQSQPSSFSDNSGYSASSASAFGSTNQAQASSFPNDGSPSCSGALQTSAVPDNSLSASASRKNRKNRLKSHLTSGARKLAARFAALDEDHGKNRPWANPPGLKKLQIQKSLEPFLGDMPDKCDFNRAQLEAANPSLAAKKETRPRVGHERTPKRKRTIDDNDDIEQTLRNMKPLTKHDILLMEKKIDALMEENSNLTAMNQHLSLQIADLSTGSGGPVSPTVTNAIQWDNEARLPAHMRDEIVADLRSECEAEKKRLREKFDDVVQKRIDKVAAAYSKEMYKRGLALKTVNVVYARQQDELHELRARKLPAVVAATKEKPKLTLSKVMVVEGAVPVGPLNPGRKRKLELDSESVLGRPGSKRRRTK